MDWTQRQKNIFGKNTWTGTPRFALLGITSTFASDHNMLLAMHDNVLAFFVTSSQLLERVKRMIFDYIVSSSSMQATSLEGANLHSKPASWNHLLDKSSISSILWGEPLTEFAYVVELYIHAVRPRPI
ncbi:uncharacterized protein PHALS_15433 [Plasmopara halstedii]|uniref:Uncharacterized protein n=1 Tax=Plasmopara halstedii TaxID=4781 RepID=A0A0P1AHT2_PLAHL|nr:uncharacterized protein PHALS_15433 [Plasmopara halstedii]CEG40270.1 hypothetical protein PHALS_15433 [Plasmopara halstedii]|eukprot:XP_024576639.1 hypothetical protein PHALS_15433 [Plasmopara halstedii]